MSSFIHYAYPSTFFSGLLGVSTTTCAYLATIIPVGLVASALNSFVMGRIVGSITVDKAINYANSDSVYSLVNDTISEAKKQKSGSKETNTWAFGRKVFFIGMITKGMILLFKSRLVTLIINHKKLLRNLCALESWCFWKMRSICRLTGQTIKGQLFASISLFIIVSGQISYQSSLKKKQTHLTKNRLESMVQMTFTFFGALLSAIDCYWMKSSSSNEKRNQGYWDHQLSLAGKKA